MLCIIVVDAFAYAIPDYVYASISYDISDIRILAQRHIRIVYDDLNYAAGHTNCRTVHMCTRHPLSAEWWFGRPDKLARRIAICVVAMLNDRPIVQLQWPLQQVCPIEMRLSAHLVMQLQYDRLHLRIEDIRTRKLHKGEQL